MELNTGIFSRGRRSRGRKYPNRLSLDKIGILGMSEMGRKGFEPSTSRLSVECSSQAARQENSDSELPAHASQVHY